MPARVCVSLHRGVSEDVCVFYNTNKRVVHFQRTTVAYNLIIVKPFKEMYLAVIHLPLFMSIYHLLPT